MFTLPQILRVPWPVFHPIFACFTPEIFLTAPNQHQLFSDLWWKSGNTAPPSLLAALSHIHSKTACRGFKSFCPCQKSQVSLLRCLTFSLVCGRIWQRGTAAPCAVRVVGACSPVGCVQAPVSAPASVGAGRSPLGSSTRGGSRDKSFCPCHKTGGNTGFSHLV